MGNSSSTGGKSECEAFAAGVFSGGEHSLGSGKSSRKLSDMILMALGLLDGYYYNTKYLENINPSEIAKIGERRDKYLRYGPYVRTKDGRRYASYDAIEEDEEKADIKNARSVHCFSGQNSNPQFKNLTWN